MIAVNLDRVRVVYRSKALFEDLSWEIGDQGVVGLVGANGSGKSTLLRLIAGEQTPEGGRVTRRKGLTVGYLAQEPRLTAGRTVFEEAQAASTELARVEAGLARLEKRLADPAVYGDEKALERALASQHRLLDDYTRLGGPGYESRVRAVLQNLGFLEEELGQPVEDLSGGQKKLLGLARLLILRPDLLLLDEPDNHLDLDGKAFLEAFLRDYPGGVILVSHDRYLLDLAVDEIVDLADGRLKRYPGNYSEYAFEKKAGLLRQQQLFQAQQKEIARLEQSAKRLMTWGKVYDNEKFSRRGKSMLKQLEKIERIERPELDRKRMGLQLEGWRGSDKVLEVEGLAKVFPDATGRQAVFENLTFLLWRQERVGLVGPNGAGKSLLFRVILGQEEPSAGRLVIGPSVQIGYYAQEQETLDPGRTLIDSVRWAAELSEQSAVAFLGRFLFTYEQSRGLVGELSGGERSRLQLALLMLSGANFLLLDEPTNNLDIPSAEVLEEALEDFEGTVFVSSHDRYFLDQVVDRILAFEAEGLVEYPGRYSEYQAARRGIAL